MNWRLAVAEQLFILSNVGAKVLVLEQAFGAVLPILLETLPDIATAGFGFASRGACTWEGLLDETQGDSYEPRADLADPLLIVYTSGTTGRPKGAVLRQEALLWNGVMSQHMHALTSDDHVLTVLPLFHVGGLNIQTTPALHLGATVTIHSRFATEATLAALKHDRPTLTVLVPATIQALTDHLMWSGADLSSLKAVSVGSTTVPQHLVDRLVARGVPVLNIYGSTETSPIAIYTRLGGDLSIGAVEQVSAADAQAQRLANAAHSMSGIVELINNITGQINLLALNATIKSARAGSWTRVRGGRI